MLTETVINWKEVERYVLNALVENYGFDAEKDDVYISLKHGIVDMYVNNYPVIVEDVDNFPILDWDLREYLDYLIEEYQERIKNQSYD